MGKLRLRKDPRGARAPDKASAEPNSLHTGIGRLPGTGNCIDKERQSHLTEGNTEALSFQGPTAGVEGSQEHGLGPGSGWGILRVRVGGEQGAGALREIDGSAAPSPQRRPQSRRRAAAPYKAALGSLGPRYIRAGLLYKAGLVRRGAAGLGPGEGVHPSSPHSVEVRHPPISPAPGAGRPACSRIPERTRSSLADRLEGEPGGRQELRGGEGSWPNPTAYPGRRDQNYKKP